MMAARIKVFLFAAGLFSAPLVAVAQIPAFPGAEGAGANSTGGRPVEKINYVPDPNNPVLEKRGTVYHVTTLDPDPEGVIEGSLLYGLKNENFWYQTHPFLAPDIDLPDSFDVTPRIIVFDVGGTIDFSSLSASERDIDITPMNFTLAGQTAPGGITIHGAEFNPGHREAWDNGFYYPDKTNNMVLRNFAIRTNDPNEKDGLWLAATNSIADHISVAWHTDEAVSITDNGRDVTVQHSILGPGWLQPDGQGSQFEGKTPMADYSVHHNLYIHNAGRIPRVGEKAVTMAPGVELDWRNNIIYNWNANEAGYSVQDEPNFTNFVNNYYIGGSGNDGNDDIFEGGDVVTRVYQSGNLLDLNFDGAANGTDFDWAAFTGTLTQVATPYSVPHGVTQTPEEALDTVMNYAGSRWWDRDFLDERGIEQLMTFGDNTLPVSERGQVLNTLDPADVNAVVNAPMQTRAANWDTDKDGMPGWWEVRHGLNPHDPDDWKLDYDSDGYINVEEYVNEIAEWPAPDDIKWSGGNGRYAEILNWGITRPNPDEADTTSNWQPTRFDTAVIDNGTVAVDTVGQHARFLRMGTNASDDATLNITAGWLKVEQNLEVGVHASAVAAVNLSNGTLDVGELSIGSSGSFSMTGGRLHVDTVSGNLVNDGGTIAPGHEISTFDASGAAESTVGHTHVTGDMTINSGDTELEIASLADFDSFSVDGAAMLGGDLKAWMVGAFIPDSDDVFEIVAANSVTDTFDNAPSELTVGASTFDVTYTATSVLLSNFSYEAPELPGDYNGDGTVDAADYTVWRDNLGEYSLLNEATSLGIVDEFDFLLWRDHFGETLGSGHGAANVPEPASLTLAALCVLLFAACRRKPAC